MYKRQGFLPGSGRLERLRLPRPKAHVRIDSGVVEGDAVTIFYDPMIAKLIVHDGDRPRALARLREALADCDIAGPASNIAFLERLVRHPAIVGATIDTGYLDRHLDEVLGTAATDPRVLAMAATAHLLAQEADARVRAAASEEPDSPWALADGWRLGHAGARRFSLVEGETEHAVVAHGHAGDYRIEVAGRTHRVQSARIDGGLLHARLDDAAQRMRLHAGAGRIVVHDGQARVRLEPAEAYRRTGGDDEAGDARIRAPMPGRVVQVNRASGDAVQAGDVVLVLEAMKMELALKAPRDGVLAGVGVQAGEFVEADAVLATLEP